MHEHRGWKEEGHYPILKIVRFLVRLSSLWHRLREAWAKDEMDRDDWVFLGVVCCMYVLFVSVMLLPAVVDRFR